MMRFFQKMPWAFCFIACIFLCNCQSKGQTGQPEENRPETAVASENSQQTVYGEEKDTPAAENTPAAATTETTLKGKVISLSTNEFRQKVFDFQKEQNWKYLGDRPCIIDFYADWCRPCKAMEPIMEKLAAEYAGKVMFYKVNVDNESALANYFQINSIPFILYCPLNDMPKSTMGGLSEEQLRQYIELIR